MAALRLLHRFPVDEVFIFGWWSAHRHLAGRKTQLRLENGGKARGGADVGQASGSIISIICIWWNRWVLISTSVHAWHSFTRVRVQLSTEAYFHTSSAQVYCGWMDPLSTLTKRLMYCLRNVAGVDKVSRHLSVNQTNLQSKTYFSLSLSILL